MGQCIDCSGTRVLVKVTEETIRDEKKSNVKIIVSEKRVNTESKGRMMRSFIVPTENQ